MEKLTTTRGTHQITDFRATRRMMVQPKVKKTYKQDGVKYYETVDGRTFNAEVYDRNFKTVAGKVKPKSDKGKNPNTKVIF